MEYENECCVGHRCFSLLIYIYFFIIGFPVILNRYFEAFYSLMFCVSHCLRVEGRT